MIDELRGRGFDVATMDWRGQGASSRALGDDSRKSYVGDFAEYDEDLDTLMQWIVRPMLGDGERPVALAHSMEGTTCCAIWLSVPAASAPAFSARQ